jgi:hypothetical protein
VREYRRMANVGVCSHIGRLMVMVSSQGLVGAAGQSGTSETRFVSGTY